MIADGNFDPIREDEDMGLEGVANYTVEEVLKKDIIKLDLGGGEKGAEGHLNIDIVYHPGVDLILDARELDVHFPSNSVDAIRCTDTLQCFAFTEVKGVLRRWNKVLKPSCRIVIQVHDIEQIMVEYEKGTFDAGKLRSLLYGNMRDEYRTYHNCFDREYIRKLLEDTGFVIQEITYPELRMKIVAKKRV